jgi:hypothetical protein
VGWFFNSLLARDYLFRLVKMGFFDLPERYPSGGEYVREMGDGRLQIMRSGLMEGGSTSVRFVFGERDHKVFMPNPPNYVPQQITQWCVEMRDLVEERIGRR